MAEQSIAVGANPYMERIDALRKRAKVSTAQDESVKPQSAKIIKLPSWPEPVRAVPNGVLRSALFGAIKKGTRRYMEGEHVAAVDGVEIRYTGQRLDQGDLDVWESVLHVTRSQEMGEQCRFTAYSLLKLMGKTDTGSNRETLHKRLMRLKANAIEVQQCRYSYAGSLIDDVYRDKYTHEYVLILNPKLRPLFAADQFTQIEWAVRHALSGHQLAQWLHGFYASHAKPFPIKVETIHRLSGSEAKQMKHFRAELREALAKLEAITGWAWEIDAADLVQINKKPTGSQARHLIRKKLKSTG